MLPSCKKYAAPRGEKLSSSPEMAVISKSLNNNNNYLGEFGADFWEEATQIHTNCCC